MNWQTKQDTEMKRLQASFFCPKKCATGKIFCEKNVPAGKTYVKACAAGKNFWTESKWILCPVDFVCISSFTDHTSELESSFFH